MDLDLAFVAAVASEGRKALLQSVESGITEEFVFGPAKDAYKFIIDYVSKYGACPSAEIIEGKTGVVVGDPAGSADFFAGEILNRDLHNRIQAGFKDPLSLLERRDPKAALDALETLVADLRKTHTGAARVISLPSLGPGVWDLYKRMQAGERGIPFPWESVNDCTLGMWPEDLIVLVARTGVGKCVEESTLLQDPVTGIRRTIREVFECDAVTRVNSWSPREGIHVRDITHKVDTGTKECKKFTFSSGKSLTVTPEHPYLTPDGWMRADQLRVGMSVAAPRKLPFPESPKPVSDAVVDFTAVMVNSGYSGYTEFWFHNPKPVAVEAMKAAGEEIGFEVEASVGATYTLKASSGNQTLEALRRDLRSFLNLSERQIPDYIYALGEDGLKSYLSLTWNAFGGLEAGRPSLTLHSKLVAEGLQHLHLRFGIQTQIERKVVKSTGKRRLKYWTLKIAESSTWDASELFSDVAFMGEAEASPAPQGPVVTSPLHDRVHDIIVTKSEMYPEYRVTLRSLLGDSFSADTLAPIGKRLDIPSFMLFCEIYGCELEFKWLWDSGLVWEVITESVNVGKKKIYDLTVAPTSCFVANDLLVHNTWAAVHITDHAWNNNKRVLFATTEISNIKIAMRFYALRYKLCYDRLRKGQLTAFEEKRFEEGIQEILKAEGLGVVGGDFDFRIESFQAAIDDHKPDLVIMDGAYLLKVKGADRIEQAANAFNELKRTAKSKKVPIVVTTQLNRNAKKSVGNSIALENIALTDTASWNADLVFGLLQSDDMRKDNSMIIKPLKIREGVMEDIDLNWNMELMDFSEKPKGDSFHNPLNPDADTAGDNFAVGDVHDDGIPF